jgi:ATPase subunit of ABC transporter with duplicated ATPase domains
MYIDNVSFKYADEEIFREISLTINKGDKIAVVGENGAGKSTLLNIVAGKIDPTGGIIRKERKERISFVEQESFQNDKININNLSGGQKRIKFLMEAISENPEILILDEPENHLDIVARKKLVDLLNEYKGKLIFVSHDEFIIDNLANKIIILENKRIQLFKNKKYHEVKEITERFKNKAFQD